MFHRYRKAPAGSCWFQKAPADPDVPVGATGEPRALARTYMHTNLFSNFQLRRLILMATTGARLGELLDSYRVRDINLETHMITIDPHDNHRPT